MKTYFHLCVQGPVARLASSEKYKNFHSGGTAQITDKMDEGTMKSPKVGVSCTGPIGNTLTYRLLGADPRFNDAAPEKARLTAVFGNANHPTLQGIHSLEISLSDRSPVKVTTTTRNQGKVQGLFDTLQRGLQKSYDMRSALSVLASAHTDLSAVATATASMPARAMRGP
ncbi:MAG: hypothetical protein H6862_07600 [Rhodospirillales bacterium]|nr:hypothetical protein [Rhodospirillales bacterium]